jgi:DNA-directed RNA polymerase subunit L
MNPHIEFTSEEHDTLSFTLSGVNVSLANGLRRTILSDIPQVVFRTTPYEQNKANIITNTSRLHNEIIKQRLSCIPIYIKNFQDFNYKNYIMEVNVENNTDTTMFVTTENFTIKDITTNSVLDKNKTKEIFPANDYTGSYIDFVRLRPKTFEELPGEKISGEKIHLTCAFDIGTAKENGMFNAVSTCAYGYTIDDVTRDTILQKKKQEWKDEGKKEDDIEFEAKNWLLLDGLRITKKDSFDFIVQSIGVYTNYEIVNIACQVLISKLNDLDTLIEKDELKITNSLNTIENCFDVILENEDYTIGKILEYLLYTKFFENKVLTFCGFSKDHPHNNDSLIRIAYKEPVDKAVIKGHFKECIDVAKDVYNKIKKDIIQIVK